jgi:hypothetical protein
VFPNFPSLPSQKRKKTYFISNLSTDYRGHAQVNSDRFTSSRDHIMSIKRSTSNLKAISVLCHHHLHHCHEDLQPARYQLQLSTS